MTTVGSPWKVLLAALALGWGGSPALAQVPAGQPFAMRGVELGITLDQFRQIDVPVDEPEHYSNFQTWCSNDQAQPPLGIQGDSEDEADGIVECQWYSTDFTGATLWHWVHIGTGGGWPVFQFMKSGDEFRLFRIKFYANNKYYPGILDALTRGYGAPAATTEPFKTLAGNDYTSTTSVWDNGLSTITLVQRCGHLERYCLTYDHSELIKPYNVLKEKRAAAAATKI